MANLLALRHFVESLPDQPGPWPLADANLGLPSSKTNKTTEPSIMHKIPFAQQIRQANLLDLPCP